MHAFQDCKHTIAHMCTHTHIHTADQLFQFIAKETDTAKTSSTYGLDNTDKSNGVTNHAGASETGSTSSASNSVSDSTKKKD